MFDKNICDLRCELPKEINEDFLMEIYEKLSLEEYCPQWDDKIDPKKWLRLSAGAWTLSCYFEGCLVHENDWVVSLYGENYSEDDQDERVSEETDVGHHWVLKKGRSPHWLDYRIPYNADFNSHALIDLHFYLLKQAQESDLYQKTECKRLDEWAAEQAEEGGGDIMEGL